MARNDRRVFGSIVRRRKLDGKFLPVNYRGREPLRAGFYVRVRVGGARAVVRYAGATKGEAEQFLAKLQRELWEEDVLGIRAVKEVTFKDYAADYLKHAGRTHTASTFAQESKRIENVLVPAFGSMLVSAIRREDVERFLAKRTQRRSDAAASIATRNRFAALLSTMFARAVALNHARANPVDGVKRPAEPIRDVPFVSLDEQTRLVEKCDPSIRLFVQLAIDTGLRRGELLALSWADVDGARGVVRVRRAKNGEPREVPVRGRSLTMLNDLRTGRVVPMTGPDRVFSWIPTSFPGNWNRLFRAAVKAAELPHLRIHDLRHCCCTNLTRAGVPLPDVAKFVGHKTLAMALRYSHHAPKDAATRALAALETFAAAEASKAKEVASASG